MRMADVRVGMRLYSTYENYLGIVTVTALTPRGFMYDLDREVSMIPRWGMSIDRTGHEHFGLNGEALFEEIDPHDLLSYEPPTEADITRTHELNARYKWEDR